LFFFLRGIDIPPLLFREDPHALNTKAANNPLIMNKMTFLLPQFPML